ncbi:MAG: sugar transporter [Pseudomonadota bacterium]
MTVTSNGPSLPAARPRAGTMPVPGRRKVTRRKAEPPVKVPPLPPAGQMLARLRARHWLVVLSFLVAFAIPAVAVNWYLHVVAADQYVSRASLTVDEDDFVTSSGMLGDLVQPISSEASDTDVLYDFITSQDMVARVDARLDLRRLYRRKAAQDPLLSLSEDDSIETLSRYWHRMVDIAYEPRQGIIGLRVRAFSPQDAQAINHAVIEESQRLINALTEAARQDAVRYAEADLVEVRARMQALFARLRDFRNANRVILPDASADNHLSIISSLQDMMAAALIERTQLVETARPGDPRIAQLDRRIAAITAQIARERAQLGAAPDVQGRALSEILAEYEEILVDIEFAVGSYMSTLAELDAARTDARRLARYLSVHITPTLAETAAYPQRLLLGALVAGLLFVIWLMAVFIAYNIRDTR